MVQQMQKNQKIRCRYSHRNFRAAAVVATSLDDFLERFYKHERYRGRGEDYAAAVRAQCEEELHREGFTFITRHSSVTGKTAAYYPATSEWVCPDCGECA